MGKSPVRRAKSLDVFVKYASQYSKEVHLQESSKLVEATDEKGQQTLLPETKFKLIASLPEHKVTIIYEETYVNRGKGFEDKDGTIQKPQDIKMRRLEMRSAIEQKGLPVQERQV